MEYELFRSKLKPLIETGLLSKTIQSSSSGVNPHQASVIELIFERSIQERRERMLTEVKSKPKKSGGVPDASVAKARPPVLAPIPAPQPPPQPLPNDVATGLVPRFVLPAAGHEGPPDPPTTWRPTKQSKKAVQREEPTAGVKANPTPLEGDIHAECPRCNTRQLRNQLPFGVYCTTCLGPMVVMRCSGCKMTRARNTEACTGCQKKFK